MGLRLLVATGSNGTLLLGIPTGLTSQAFPYLGAISSRLTQGYYAQKTMNHDGTYTGC